VSEFDQGRTAAFADLLPLLSFLFCFDLPCNIIWEVTQAIIALSVVGTCSYTIIVAVSQGSIMDATNMAERMGLLIVGSYFGNTNHQQVGGVDLGRYE
jgi:hypothetical protein